jgi:hypothetical protein
MIRATQAHDAEIARVGNPLLARYFLDLQRNGLWKVIVFFYIVLAILVLAVWPMAMGGAYPHPEILMKLTGAYCLLIATLAVPLVSPLLFPPVGELDPSFDSSPISDLQGFNARFLATMPISVACLVPLLIVFPIFGPSLGHQRQLLDIMPFLQGILTTAWVILLMEMTGQSESSSGLMARRLALIAGFILVHLTLIGLIGQMSFSTLTEAKMVKLLIDLNPFSQLFILMEGPSQTSLVFTFYVRGAFDYRLFLFVDSAFVLFLTWIIYRNVLQARSTIV